MKCAKCQEVVRVLSKGNYSDTVLRIDQSETSGKKRKVWLTKKNVPKATKLVLRINETNEGLT